MISVAEKNAQKWHDERQHGDPERGSAISDCWCCCPNCDPDYEPDPPNPYWGEAMAEMRAALTAQKERPEGGQVV